MLAKPSAVSIADTAGRQWWETPDALWRGMRTTRARRLRLVVGKHILPLLQQLEALYLDQHAQVTPKLAGRPMEVIENDDEAIEAGLCLFELALNEGLITFGGPKKGKARAKEKKKGNGKDRAVDPKNPLPCCGMTLEQGRQYYFSRACQAILAKTGKPAANLKAFLPGGAVSDLETLQLYRRLVGLNISGLKELRAGLKNRFPDLLAKDAVYLNILGDCSLETVVRALRKALGKNFAAMLDWSPEFLGAVTQGLDHTAKIAALGPDLLVIEDAEVVRALGAWGIKEVEEKKGGKKTRKKIYVTRIEQVRKIVGPDNFKSLLTANPEVLEMVGAWSNDQLDGMKLYIPYMTPGIANALAPLPPQQQAGIMNGLWHRLGRDYLEIVVNDPSGEKMTLGLVAEIQKLDKGKTTGDDIKELLLGDFFAQYFVGLPPKK